MHVVIPIVAGIGNALLAVPMVRQLKRGMPQARLTILARIKAMGEVFERLPEVDEVEVMEAGGSGALRTVRKHSRPDVFLVPFPSNRWQYSLLALASRARRKVMHSYPVGYFRALGFVGERMPAVRGIHDVEQNLRLLALFGIEPDLTEAPRFEVRDDDRLWASHALAPFGLNDSSAPLIIHSGSAQTVLAAAKRWPPEQYAKVIHRVRESHPDWPILLIEGPDEKGNAEAIRRAAGLELPTVCLSGPLAHAAAVLERASMYLGSDSGLAHLAAAVGTPPVTIFGPADPQRVCPFGYRDLVVQPAGKTCGPCMKYPFDQTYPAVRCREPMCVRSVPIEGVLAAIERGWELGRARLLPSRELRVAERVKQEESA